MRTPEGQKVGGTGVILDHLMLSEGRFLDGESDRKQDLLLHGKKQIPEDVVLVLWSDQAVRGV